jgi:hypothetical protein
LIIGHNPFYPPQFRSAKSNISLQPDGVQPNLCDAVLAFNVNVRRLALITGVEE